MKRLLWLAPLLFVAVMAGAGGPAQEKRPHGTPTPTPEPEIGEEEAPEPTPTPEPPRFVAALESSQGDGGERVAVFADGTLVSTTRWKERRVTRRLVLSHEELDVIRRVTSEALSALDEESLRGDVLAPSSERRMKLEIAEGEDGPPRVFFFDDTTALSHAVGRARGALEDLRSRFVSRTIAGRPDWTAEDVAPGDRLRRRSDGLWFVVVRDDTFERNIELSSEEGGLIVWVTRQQIPREFFDPTVPSPEPAPPEPPR